MKDLLCNWCGYKGDDCPYPQEKHCELFVEYTDEEDEENDESEICEE